MVKNPITGTEPHVQRSVMGHTGKLVWGESPAGVGLCA